MSSANPPGSPATVVPAGAVPVTVVPPARTGEQRADPEIRVYGHGNLFYWWPVWFVGFVMAALTYSDGHMMAVVPEGTLIERGAVVDGQGGPRDVLVAPEREAMPAPSGRQLEGQPAQPRLRVAASNNYGVIFVGTLLLCIAVTNFMLRGMASVVVLALLIILSLTFALMGWWDAIFNWLGGLDVRMNAGGYLAISIPLFILWCFGVFVYDHYTYLVVTRGQIRIRQAIGDGEVAVDTSAVMLDKKRNDFFRHWLLGFGSGDLHVKTGGVANMDFELPNVLGIGWKIDRIQNLMREKEVSDQA